MGSWGEDDAKDVGLKSLTYVSPPEWKHVRVKVPKVQSLGPLCVCGRGLGGVGVLYFF